jgi:hypothetical protein
MALFAAEVWKQRMKTPAGGCGESERSVHYLPGARRHGHDDGGKWCCCRLCRPLGAPAQEQLRRSAELLPQALQRSPTKRHSASASSNGDFAAIGSPAKGLVPAIEDAAALLAGSPESRKAPAQRLLGRVLSRHRLSGAGKMLGTYDKGCCRRVPEIQEKAIIAKLIVCTAFCNWFGIIHKQFG